MFDPYSVKNNLRHAKNRIDGPHTTLAQQRETGHAEKGVERVGKISGSVCKPACLAVLKQSLIVKMELVEKRYQLIPTIILSKLQTGDQFPIKLKNRISPDRPA